MKKIFTFLFLFQLCLLNAQTYSGGSGTVGDPFQIANLTDLRYLSEHDTEWDKHFIQTANIDATATNTWNVGDHDGDDGASSAEVPMGFLPIGSLFTPIIGSYKGGDFSISNLFINRPQADQVGLFGAVGGGTIENLTLTNINYTCKSQSGGIVGRTSGSGTVLNNLHVSGVISGNDAHIGGIVGYLRGTIRNSSSTCTILSISSVVGGLCGSSINSSNLISNCSSHGDITGSNAIGGLIGSNIGTISNSYATGNVTATGSGAAGGFAGFLNTGSQIYNCYASGNVTATGDDAGGFVGKVTLTNETFRDCFALGNVSGNDAVGGFAGDIWVDNISNCYSKGAVTGSSNVGGFIGYKFITSVNNCFWDTETSGNATSDGGTGLTNTQMQSRSNFTSWDFLGETANGTDDHWYMDACSSGSYPKLRHFQSFFKGAGTSGDPYLIENKQDLKELSENSCFTHRDFKQTADISFVTADFQIGGDFYDGGAGFIPLNYNGSNGTYDGDGHTIDGLYISRGSSSDIGFIGVMSGTVKNLGLTNVDITGDFWVGGIVGFGGGTIENCFVTGAVRGDIVGGIIGNQISSSGIVKNCYNAASIICTGGTLVGGVSGDTYGTIENCYNYGNVSGAATYSGALLGRARAGSTITNSFWNNETSGVGSSPSGASISSEDMRTQSTFTIATWDFLTSPIWKMGECNNSGFPVLNWQTITNFPTVTGNTPASRCGSGAITLEAVPSSGSIKWFTASTGGSALVDDADYDLSGDDLTINNLASSTTYYAEANNGGCVSTSRTAVLATINNLPTITSNTPSSRCGSGSITLEAVPSAGLIKWFTASTGGTAIVDDADYDFSGNDLIINNLTSTTSFYAEADNGGCLSAARTEVIATINTCYSGGDGTIGDPYQIANKADLKRLSETSADWASHFIQTANISFINADFENGGAFYNTGNGFIPIGNTTTAFTGRYNGQNYSIENLKINRSTEDNIGLFGYGESGLNIRNINLMNVDIIGRNYTGALIGQQNNFGDVTNCHVDGNITAQEYCGGLIGRVNGTYVTDASSNITLNAFDRAGGFIGRIEYGIYTRCTAKGSVIIDVDGGYQKSAGFTGFNNRGEFNNCYTTCNVTDNSGYAEIAGFTGVASFGIFTNCYANNTVLNAINNGGFSRGFLISQSSGTFTSCYWNSDKTSTNPATTGITGKTDSEMKIQGTFVGYTFPTVWKIDAGCKGYPIFQWENDSPAFPTISSSTPASRCGTGTVSLGATASAGDVKWYADATGGSALFTGASFTTPSISSTTTYYAEADNGGCVSASRTAVVATVELTTQVQASQQGSTLPFLGSNSFTGTPIIADAVLGATRYRFEVTEGENTVFLTRNGRWFYLSNLPSYDYGKTYSIRVCVELGGDFGCYGNSYDVSSPLLPPTSQVIAEQRGTTMASMYNWIKAEERAGATNYRFRVTFNSATEVIETTNRYFYLSQLNNATYDTEYEIEVAVEHPNIPGFGDYGTPYSVFSPAITQVQSSQCSITLDNNSTVIIADAVQGATGYRFEVTQNGSTEVLTRSSRWFYLANLTSYLPNRIMKVRVSVQKGGVWGPYWTSCYITTPASGMIKNPNEEQLDKFVTVELNAYPNPNNGEFTISSSHEGLFNIINELGQLVQRVEITKENNYQMHVDGLRNGIYFITGTINDKVITNKIVVH
jgi:hypothetical protein